MKEEDDLKLGDWKKLKNGFFHESFKRRGYVFKKQVILPFFILLILIFFYGLHVEGLGLKWSYYCPEDTPMPGCPNPFYKDCHILSMNCAEQRVKDVVCADDPVFCQLAISPPGTKAGHEPGPVTQNFDIILVCALILAYGLNHLLYNSTMKRKIRREAYGKTNKHTGL